MTRQIDRQLPRLPLMSNLLGRSNFLQFFLKTFLDTWPITILKYQRKSPIRRTDSQSENVKPSRDVAAENQHTKTLWDRFFEIICSKSNYHFLPLILVDFISVICDFQSQNKPNGVVFAFHAIIRCFASC